MIDVRSASRISQIEWKSLAVASLQIIFFTALTAVCAQVRIPLPGTPVPITLQSLAVILSGAILGSRKGSLSQILLVAVGMAGYQVFSQPIPGHLVLLGPTGGYILGFVFAAFVAGIISVRLPRASFLQKNLYLFVASLFIFVPGVIWLKVLTGQNWAQAVAMGFLPFLLGDVLKTVAAASFTTALEKIRR